MALADEERWFNENRAFIAQNYAGKFVIIKDQTVRGAYDRYDLAYNAGAQMFPGQPFLIKEATLTDRVERI